jgi:hypothetical protein
VWVIEISGDYLQFRFPKSNPALRGIYIYGECQYYAQIGEKKNENQVPVEHSVGAHPVARGLRAESCGAYAKE